MTNCYLLEKYKTYQENSKEGEKQSSWHTYFNNHKKKDDLADCFLQGLWWIKNRLN